jgi:hypothetical protein
MLCMQIEIKEPISGYLFHFIELNKSEVSIEITLQKKNILLFWITVFAKILQELS